MKKKRKVLTDRQAPFLAGLYSLQAVAASSMDPDVTIYRTKAKEALAWMRHAVEKKKFKYYLLRHSQEAWDVYDYMGELIGLYDAVSEINPDLENGNQPEGINREEFGDEVRAFAEDPKLACLAHIEGHSEARAVDHSNFHILCRRIVLEAEPKDLEKFYFIDTRRWSCRVMGLFADVGSLSTKIQDAFLERVRHINRGRPLVAQHHKEVLADKLVNSRMEYTSSLVRKCAVAGDLGGDVILGMNTAWSLTPAKDRYPMALHIVKTLYGGIEFHNYAPETFSDEVIRRAGPELAVDIQREMVSRASPR